MTVKVKINKFKFSDQDRKRVKNIAWRMYLKGQLSINAFTKICVANRQLIF